MLSEVRAALASTTAGAWRAHCSPVQWLARISAIVASAASISRDAHYILIAECDVAL
jgi:hypothetical protein